MTIPPLYTSRAAALGRPLSRREVVTMGSDSPARVGALWTQHGSQHHVEIMSFLTGLRTGNARSSHLSRV